LRHGWPEPDEGHGHKPGSEFFVPASRAFCRLLLVLFSVALLLAPSQGWCYGFFITDRTATGVPQATLDQYADTLQSMVNLGLFSAGPHGTDEFLKAAGDANAQATRGMGVDATSYYNHISLTAQGGFAQGGPASSGADQSSNTLPAEGIGAQTALTVSMPATSLGISSFFGLDARRVDIGFNGMHLRLDGKVKNLGMNFSTYGFGVSYWMGTPSHGFILRFNGLRLTTGFQYAQEKVAYNTPVHFTTSSGGYTMAYSSGLGVNLNSTIYTIPVELTTGFTIMRLLSVAGGIGAGFNFGSSMLSGGATGPIQMTRDSDGAVVGTGTSGIDVTAPAPVAPVLVDYRVFIGPQINLFNLKIFAQGSLNSQRIITTSAGVRLVL
jgi:hypothetical protein